MMIGRIIIAVLVLAAIHPVEVESAPGDVINFLCDFYSTGTMVSLLPEGVPLRDEVGSLCSAPSDADACAIVSQYVTCESDTIVEIDMHTVGSEVYGTVPNLLSVWFQSLRYLNFADATHIDGMIHLGDSPSLVTLITSRSSVWISYSPCPSLITLRCSGPVVQFPMTYYSSLSNIEELVMTDSPSVTGVFPDLSITPNLRILDFSNTAITGTLSTNNLRALTSIDVHDTAMSGVVSLPSLATSSVLHLNMANTRLRGSFASTSLTDCDITNTCLTELGGDKCLKATNYHPCAYASNQCMTTSECLVCSSANGNEFSCSTTTSADGVSPCNWCAVLNLCLDANNPTPCYLFSCGDLNGNSSECVSHQYTDNCVWCVSTQRCETRGEAGAIGCKACQQFTDVGNCTGAFADATTPCSWCNSTAMCIDSVNNPVRCLTAPETLPDGPLAATAAIYPPSITTQLSYSPIEVFSIAITLPRVKGEYDRFSIMPSFVSEAYSDPECWTLTQGSTTHTASVSGTMAEVLQCGGSTVVTTDDAYVVTWTAQLVWQEWVGAATPPVTRADAIAFQRSVVNQFVSIITISRTKDLGGTITSTKDSLVYATYEQSTVYPSPGLPSVIVIKFATYTTSAISHMVHDNWVIPSMTGNIANISVPVSIPCGELVTDTEMTGTLECWLITVHQATFACSTSAADGFMLEGAIGNSENEDIVPVTFHFALSQGEQWCNVVDVDTITGDTSFYDSALYTSHTTAFYIDGDLYVRVAWDTGNSFTIEDVEMVSVTVAGNAVTGGEPIVYVPDEGLGGIDRVVLIDAAEACEPPNICYTFHVAPSLYNAAEAISSIEITTQCRLSYSQFAPARSVRTLGQVSRRSTAWATLIAPYETSGTPTSTNSSSTIILSSMAKWLAIVAVLWPYLREKLQVGPDQ